MDRFKTTLRPLFILIIWASAASVSAQHLNLEMCYELAMDNYPMAAQYDLISKSRGYTAANAASGSLPQIIIGGQASYQSDVTQFPLQVPGLDIPAISKDQYQLYGEVSQPLTGLITAKHQKRFAVEQSETAKKAADVEMYQLKERINQLYFGILLLDARIEQVHLLMGEISRGSEINRVAIENGLALHSSADLLKAEMLIAEQRLSELKFNRTAFTEMLSQFIGIPVTDDAQFAQPDTYSANNDVDRPELYLFDTRKKVLSAQSALITDKTLPHLSLFVQGGYGRPALNMLKNDFEFFYIGGIRLVWNISGYYTRKNEQQLIYIEKDRINLEKDTFLFNVNMQLKQQHNEILKLKEMVAADKKIIALRENVVTSAQNQLKYGTLTTTEYMTHVNAVDAAKQDMILHEIQLLLKQHTIKTIEGN